MSPKNSQHPSEEKTNPNLKSSIVHKPFDTGTVNIFNPHRNQSNDRSNTPELFLDEFLEELEEPKIDRALRSIEVEDRDSELNKLVNPWSVSAIAIVFFANLISAAVIWRNHSSTAKTEVESISSLGSANLATKEFVPLNLSTLSILKTAEDVVEEPAITPIAPALAPLNSVAISALNPEYYYVLTEYTGDRSLALARQKVKQVSLVNFPEGVFIYLGAFKDKAQADEFVTQLKKENFLAQIYPFD